MKSTILKLAASAALAAVLGAPALAQAPAPAQGPKHACQALPVDKIGIQLYSLNPVLQPRPPGPPPAPGAPRTPPKPADPAVVDATLGKLHDIGYRNVENAGIFGMTPTAFKALLAKHQLKMVGSHGSLDPATFDKTIQDALDAGQGPLIGSSGFGPPGLGSLENTLATAKNLNALGQKAAAKGLHLYLHNHTGEFDAKYPYDINHDGKLVPTTAWEIVAANTDPRYVNFEVDVHWARRAFGNNQDAMLNFIRKYSDRIILFHIKDTGGDKIVDLGTGDTDWPLVYAAGKKVQYYIFEYDNPPDPLKSAEIAFNYMTCRS
jgi:sugar phosphate isomerase/epimerase